MDLGAWACGREDDHFVIFVETLDSHLTLNDPIEGCISELVQGHSMLLAPWHDVVVATLTWLGRPLSDCKIGVSLAELSENQIRILVDRL